MNKQVQTNEEIIASLELTEGLSSEDTERLAKFIAKSLEWKDQQWLDKIKRAFRTTAGLTEQDTTTEWQKGVIEGMGIYSGFLLAAFKDEGIDLESITKNEND